ncbi:hypothetical protein WN944_005987 [Citrus x changshan-huyou]|uniref:Transducin/WD40 repeat-like superfamily protein n=1 Tax=Citrus x changshan-huyou TaxID=2935761 RepID=A0AAP0MID4_9ROSI
MDFHKSSSYLVTASDDESIRPYDVSAATNNKVSFEIKGTLELFFWGKSLRFLSLHDNKYLRYFKGHHDRFGCLACAPPKIALSLVLLIKLFCSGINGLRNARPATAYDDQGLVFAVAFGGYIRMFDARKYEKGPFDIFSDGEDVSDSDVIKFSNDGRIMLPTTMEGHICVLDSFKLFWKVLMMVVDMLGVYGAGKGVASWMSFHRESPVIKWAPGSLMFVTGSSELSFWNPNVSKLGAYFGRK